MRKRPLNDHGTALASKNRRILMYIAVGYQAYFLSDRLAPIFWLSAFIAFYI